MKILRSQNKNSGGGGSGSFCKYHAEKFHLNIRSFSHPVSKGGQCYQPKRNILDRSTKPRKYIFTARVAKRVKVMFSQVSVFLSLNLGGEVTPNASSDRSHGRGWEVTTHSAQTGPPLRPDHLLPLRPDHIPTAAKVINLTTTPPPQTYGN